MLSHIYIYIDIYTHIYQLAISNYEILGMYAYLSVNNMILDLRSIKY